MKTLKFLILVAAFILSAVSLRSQDPPARTAGEIIDLIIKQTGSAPVTNTVDVIKAGDPQTRVTGIVSCMFATMDVLKKAVSLKCNLIICHEPVFYNHRDETKLFQNDPVFLEKKRYIDQNGLVIWRFHDYVHRINPDAIDQGMAIKLGFEKYIVDKQVNRFIIPETTLTGLLQDLKKIFPKSSFQVIGDPLLKISKVMFSAGAPGSSVHIGMLQDSNVDLVIAGEVPQWETYEYVRDAVQQGRKKAIIFLGHVPSEEAGMEFAAGWMKGFIKDIPVNFVECGSPYRTY